MDSQAAANGPAGGTHRMNRVLGGAEIVVDETGERMREEFLNFLETYTPFSGMGPCAPGRLLGSART